MDLRSAWSRWHQVGFVASNSRANIIVVADEEQLEKVMQVQINADNDGQIFGENIIILEMMKHDQGEEQFEPPQSGCSIFWRGEPIIIVKMWITVLAVFAKCHNSTSKIPLWLNWCIQQQSYKITTKKLKQLTLRHGVRMRLGTSPADPWKFESGQMVSEKVKWA